MPAKFLPALGFALALGLVVGATVALRWTGPGLPSPLAPGSAAASAAVAVRDYDDPRDITVQVTSGRSSSAPAPRSGVVTRYDCLPGGAMASGASALSLDGDPVIALHTATPLWRDLASGTRGPDAQALNDELVRLGYTDQTGDTVTWATLQAFRALARAVGSSAASADGIPRTAFVFLPQASAAVAECTTNLGAPVAEGASLWTYAEPVLQAGIGPPPPDWMPGTRVVQVDGVRLPLADDGTIAPDAAGQLAALPSFQAATATGGRRQISAKAVLAQPTAVAAVPPSALFGIAGSSACVVADGVVTTVQIVGSQLGVSFVLGAGLTGDAVTVNLTPTAGTECPPSP